MDIKAFFDKATFTLTYVAFDPASRDAIIIDPVLDFDPLTWSTSTTSAEMVRDFVRDKSLNVRWVVDTHAHADHLSGMQVVKDYFGAPAAIGKNIAIVQKVFAEIYNLKEFKTDGSQWDQLLDDGQTIEAGTLSLKALHTPGHTPACMSYLIEDAVFTGDAIFMPDYGTGRCDFPKGSADALYTSITEKLYKLPPSTRMFVGHDYLPGGRELAYETTVGEQMEQNVQLGASTSREDFIRFRTERDATLKPPKLILQSLQVNIDAGNLPAPEDNGQRYLKMPINFLGG